jgi:hypothetical protein
MKQLVLLTLALAACDAAPVFPTADLRQHTVSGRIEGHVVVQSVARGKVVLFLYDAARPPPPVGTGRPVTFTVVSRDALFGAASEGSAGPFTAPYAFSLVAPGTYLIRGFVDANDDFIPWYGVTSDVNTGDVGDAAIDPATGAQRVIEIALDASGQPVPVLDVSVSMGDPARVPVDRPVWETATATASLGATAIEFDLTLKPIAEGAINEGAPIFLASLVDANGDGVPDDSNGDGVPDFWPRVFVRKVVDAAPLLDENDLDKNGVLDTEPGFADYEHVNPMTGETIPADGKPDLVVLAAGFKFNALVPQLLDADGKVKKTPTPVTSLTLVIKPLALDASDPSAPQVIKGVPPGTYAVTVVQLTGQTWRVPNELSPEVAANVGLPSVTSQSFVVTVPRSP